MYVPWYSTAMMYIVNNITAPQQDGSVESHDHDKEKIVSSFYFSQNLKKIAHNFVFIDSFCAQNLAVACPIMDQMLSGDNVTTV